VLTLRRAVQSGRGNLHRRLTLTLVAQTVVVLLLTALALFLVLGRFLRAGEAQRLERLVSQVSIHPDSEKHELLEFEDEFPDDVHVRLLSDGAVVAATPGFPAVATDTPLGYSLSAQHQVLVRAIREDDRQYILQLAGDPAGIRLALRAYLLALAVIVPVAAVVVALLSNWVAAGMLAPVRRLELAAATVSTSQQLRTPLPGAEATDELGRLAHTLQTTFGQLADGMDREVAFLRAAAHDLRSPLTALKTRIEGVLARSRDAGAYRAALAELRTDVDRMVRLVDHLLVLAKDGAPVAQTTLDLAKVVAATVDAARAARPGMVLTTSLAPDTPLVTGDSVLLAQLLGNLLENAAHHAPGAPTHVRMWREGGGGAALEVRDAGPGVDESELERLGEAFYRPDASRSSTALTGHPGSGLGLAIVKRIVEWHGAQWVLSSRPGAGFSVTVRFPSADPPG
jgi:signal transduction histidine kinase